MTIGLVGRKCGMTRVFTEAGESVPVTVVEVLANRVTQVKDEATELSLEHFLRIKLGFEICEDAWVAKRPGGELALRGIDVSKTELHLPADVVDLWRAFQGLPSDLRRQFLEVAAPDSLC